MPRLETEVWLPRSPEEIFPFYADAGNLERLTPPWLRFQIVTPAPIAMGVGTLIDYRLRLHGLRIAWRSEITAWEPPHRFVDEQRRGPFRHWVHEHLLGERDGGSALRDRVCYETPGGGIVDRLLVRRDLERIFAYRRGAILELLGQRDSETVVAGSSGPLEGQQSEDPLEGPPSEAWGPDLIRPVRPASEERQ